MTQPTRRRSTNFSIHKTRGGHVLGMAVVVAIAAGAFTPGIASAATPNALVDSLDVLEVTETVDGQSAEELVALANSNLSTSDVDEAVEPLEAQDFEITLDASTRTGSRRDGSGVTEEPGVELGDTGISVSLGGTSDELAAIESLTELQVHLQSADAIGAEGIGITVSLLGADPSETVELAIRVPEDLLEGRYGADYVDRLRWVQADEDTTSTSPVDSSIDVESKEVVLAPTVSSKSVTISAVATATSSTGTGSYAATPLNESSSWDVSAQTGAFAWSYSMRTPPPASGPAPDLGLDYDSQAVDGETSSTNNQVSSVGEGWTSSVSGFIERTYVSCAQDNDEETNGAEVSGDQCWKKDNATLSLAGHSGSLVRVGTSEMYRLQNDDGTRIEKVTGNTALCDNGTYNDECWVVTTTDGTKYYFGKTKLPGWATGKELTDSTWTVPVFGDDTGDPCHASTFATSSCVQGWRWNLDYVVDVHSNAQALFYYAESNKYRRNNTTAVTYQRGGQIDRILYGFRDGQVFTANAPSGKVVFGYAANGRCATTSGCSAGALTAAAVKPTTPANYPDVPWDQFCNDTTCTGKKSPTFWSNGMLQTITTSALISAAYVTVDVWTLGHSFPNPGDGNNASMWLTQIAHRGKTATATEPTTVFNGTALQNRVWEYDGLSQLNKFRLSSIRTSLGALITVNYSPQQCDVENSAQILDHLKTNHNRCFPQWWSPDVSVPQEPQLDLFHKYVVTSTFSDPRTGGGGSQVLETYYEYTGTPEWRMNVSPFTPKKHRTYSIWAGYDEVEVHVGRASEPDLQVVTRYRFFQGVDGKYSTPTFVINSSSIRDRLQWAGRTREVVTLRGVGGPVTSTKVFDPWTSEATATQGELTAFQVDNAKILLIEPSSTSTDDRTHTTTTTFNSAAAPIQVEVLSSDGLSTCTTTDYTPRNVSSPIMMLPWHTKTVAKSCALKSTAVLPEDAIAEARVSYDGSAPGVAPTKGDQTKREEVATYSGSTPIYQTTATSTYDVLGRPLVEVDGAGLQTTKTYVPAATAAAGSGGMRQVTVANSKLWTTVTNYELAWGETTSVIDPNGATTTVKFDDLGRRTAVWEPGRPQASYADSPSIEYSYTRSVTLANVVKTTVVAPISKVSSYELYDGLGRDVQTQDPANGSGAVVSDTYYDSRGRISRQNSAYPIAISAGASLFVPASQNQIGASIRVVRDGAGRDTDVILESLGVERSRVQYSYFGADRVDVLPPSGGTRTSTLSNSEGQTVSLTEFESLSTSSTAAGKVTLYEYDNRQNLVRMTDPAQDVWSWKYDLRGNNVEFTSPDSGATAQTFDAVGRLISAVDARGKTIFHTYDALNRITAQYEGSNAESGLLLSRWGYDDSIRKGQTVSKSSFTGSTEGNPGLEYKETIDSFDAQNRPLSRTLTIPVGAPAFGGTSRTVAVTYNQAGMVRDAELPAEAGLPAETLEYSYNGLGGFESLSGLGATYALASYTPLGQLAQIQRSVSGTSGNLTTAYGYDISTGAIDQITHAKQVGSAYDVINDTSYSRNAAGQIVSIDASLGSDSETQCFEYDGFQNLTDAWTPSSQECGDNKSVAALGGPAPYWNTYAVDTNTGNRIAATVRNPAGQSDQSYSYPTAAGSKPHALATLETVTNTGTTVGEFTYDSSGNVVSRPGQTLTYDALGRVSTVSTSHGTQEFVYGPTGDLLIQKDPSSGSTLFVGETEIHSSPTSQLSATRTYAAAGAPVAERNSKVGSTNGVLTWLASDTQGTASLSVDATTGTIARRYADPFGVARGIAPVWTSAHGFLNASTSAFTDLVHLGAREYDPKLGRFLSVDAVVDPGNPRQNNGYSYSHNNPVTLSDPSGNIPIGGGHVGVRQPRAGETASSTPAAAGNKASTKSPPKTKQVDWWNPTTYEASFWQDAAAVGAGVLATVVVTSVIIAAVGCTAVTFGVCGAVVVGAVVVGSAVGAWVTYSYSTGEKSPEAARDSVLMGAAGGLLGLGAGTVLGKVGSAVGSKMAAAAAKKEAAAAAAAAANATSDALDDALVAQVKMVAKAMDETGKPPPGVLQGKAKGTPRGVFTNEGEPLPPNSDPFFYSEVDVYPHGVKPNGKALRDPNHRIVMGGGRVWYSPDHYKNFVEIPRE